ncbi:polysaccharide biosynthesis C-terminal domain-containing protein, partial [bacterium]|nr:polysaccharide biosynthesis C-terminal domain-containing protein [bacterium]
AAAVRAAYAVGIPAGVLVKASAAVFFARGDAATPLRAAVATAAANVAFSLALMPWLGAAGIALATSLAAAVNLAWLWMVLARRRETAPTAGLAGPTPRVGAGWTGLAILVGGGAATYVGLLAVCHAVRSRRTQPTTGR